MNAQPPHEFSVDPAAPRLPENFPVPPAGSGEVVLLLAEREARPTGWTAALALEIARDWAAQGRPTFLADGDLVDAPLHLLAGLPNDEGVSDLLHFGASPTRVARPTVAGEYYFISAGTPVADPAGSYRHARWSPLLRAFRESGSLFLLYLPADAPGIEGLLAEGDRVLRLTEEASTEGEGPGITRILGGSLPAADPDAWVEASAPVGIEPEADEADGIALSETAAASSALTGEADGWTVPAPAEGEIHSGAPQPAHLQADIPPGDPVPAPIVLPRDPRSGALGSRDRTHPPVWLLLVVLLLVVTLLVAARMGVVNIPGVTPAGAVSLFEAIGGSLDRLG